MRAIALSLGQESSATAEKGSEQQEKEKREEDEERKRKEAEEKERERLRLRELLKPIDSATLDDFSNELLPRCVELASSVAESVYRTCDLISALAKRNGKEWTKQALLRVKTSVRWLVRECVVSLSRLLLV